MSACLIVLAFALGLGLGVCAGAFAAFAWIVARMLEAA